MISKQLFAIATIVSQSQWIVITIEEQIDSNQ